MPQTSSVGGSRDGAAGAGSRPKATAVLAWEDDPLSEGAVPVERPVPVLSKGRLKLAIDLAQPPPGRYEPGTAEFRYWTAADALARAVQFWAPMLPRGTTWQRGAELAVRLDAGDTLDALYNRDSLCFFHANVKGHTIYTGESPDVVTHEAGHAVLDAIRPQLWDAMSGEVAAFHESFADISALLTALQLPSIQAAVLADTGGVLNRSSRLSRLAEQLGWAIRQRQPCSVEGDCLRSAVNCFIYQPPELLPIVAPAVALSSEPHSYSRVFTGAFWITLTGMAHAIVRPADANALKVASVDAGRLLVAAVRAAPIVPDYMAQLAGHLLAADRQLFDGKYATAIRNGFVLKGVLAASAVPGGDTLDRAAAVGRSPRRPRPELPELSLNGRDIGLGDRPILCRAAAEAPRLAVAALANDGGPAAAASAEESARNFLRELIARDRVAVPGTDPGERLHTHEILDQGGVLRVVRRLVDDAESPPPPAPKRPASDDEARFVQALIARGEAARAVDGMLPDGATHEIVEDDDGRISVVRRRFSSRD